MLGFFLGAIVGSFLATLIVRWPQGRSLGGRSACDACHVAVRPAQLVPLLSYIFLEGRCRACGASIDRRHFRIELAAAFIGLIAFAVSPDLTGAASAVFGWWLLTLAALDAEHHWLPDRLTLPLLPAGLLASFLPAGPMLTDRLIGVAAGYVILASLALAYRQLRGREGLGGGDPKLLAAIGAWLGWQFLPFVLLGAGLLGLAALAVAGARGRRITAEYKLPLGTLMAAAAWPLWLLMVA